MTASDYLHSVLSPTARRDTIQALVKALRIQRRTVRFDAIAFRGMSGALVAPSVADALGVALLMVRKERSHSDKIVEGDLDATAYVIVDDFVSSGDTVRAIVAEVQKAECRAPCVGVMTYRRQCWSEGDGVRLPDDTVIPVWCIA